MDDLKYPIGPSKATKNPTSIELAQWINDIKEFPTKVENLIANLNDEELNWKYRPYGWSIKQVVHHCSDSHLNSFIRFKWALTEDTPIIKPYYEERWAELPDSLDNDLTLTLNLLKALHQKWVFLLKTLNQDQLKKEFIHPDHGNHVSIEENIGIYAWHCNHHLAHIAQGIEAKGMYNLN